ncbi:hypothetical protein ABH922_003732 [Rhodococcus sp. 27YEA15]|uniref:hypothetical protein n=1 Tax=Rhodococcus sp. 27YEA15 TaxID=3156259 RepID=UPI003C7B4868
MADIEWTSYPDRRSARRAAVRKFHPDIGGSADALRAALTDIDALFADAPSASASASASASGEVTVLRSFRGTVEQLAKPVRVRYKKFRARLPGARTYTEI